MEKTIMDAAATAALDPAPGSQDARARAPYEPPELEAVGLGPVFADEYVYSYDAADNDFSSSGLFG